MIFSSFLRSRKILIIGSCHLDVFADFSNTEKNYFDKIGAIRFSIGGTGFNIAMNLARRNHSVSMFSVLRKGSVISEIILFKLSEVGVRTKYLKLLNTEHESGFVAHREDGRPVSAVTATLFEISNINRNSLYSAISRHNLIILDCNATEHQIVEVVKICSEQNKRLIVAAVSDTKASRMLCSEFAVSDNTVSVVSMNEREAKSINIDIEAFSTDAVYADSIMTKLRTGEICITRGAGGLLYRFRGDRTIMMPAPAVSKIASTSGAGDAVLSAIAEWKINNDTVFDNLSKLINQYVVEVLSTEDSNTGGVASTDQFLVLRKRVPLVIKIGQNTIIFNFITLLGTILSAVGIIAAIMHWW